MKHRVLLVHPDAEMLVALTELVADVGDEEGYDFSVRQARHASAAASQAARGTVDLLVCALEIAPDDQTPMAAGDCGSLGLALARQLRQSQPALRVLLLSGEAVSAETAAQLPSGCELIDVGGPIAAAFKAAVKRLFGPPDQPASQRVELVISLSTSKGCGYQFQRGGGRPEPWRPLTMDAGKLRDLVDQSCDVHVGTPSWEREFKRLGEAFADELFSFTPNNLAFRDDFHKWVGKVGIDNIHVRFMVEDDLHPIAVEALKQRDNDYWMLRTAVYRGQEPYRDPLVLEPRGLFQDEQTRTGPIRFLVIQADAPVNAVATIGRQTLSFDPLPRLDDEVAVITGVLARAKAQGQAIGEVRVLRRSDVPADGSFAQQVEQTLKNGPWHIVHYAGHTHYDPQQRAGYLLFPGEAGQAQMVAAKVDLFAWQLRNADTRFVFLSSCQSAGQDFIYHLAKERVPAIMGYLWKVNNERAIEFARSFYGHLLDGGRHPLEQACFEAKKEMHARCSDDAIWASPVLVMQVSA